MKKLLALGITSLVALATLAPLSHAETAGTITRSKSGTELTQTQVACVKAAVNTRELAVRSAYVTLSNAQLEGLDARLEALSMAWTYTNKMERKLARQTAWATWNTTSRTARAEFKVARKSAWDTFRASVKVCQVPSSEVESSTALSQDVQ